MTTIEIAENAIGLFLESLDRLDVSLDFEDGEIERATAMTLRDIGKGTKVEQGMLDSHAGLIAERDTLRAVNAELLAASVRAFHLIDNEDNNPVICEMAGSFGLWIDLKDAIDKAKGATP